MSAEPVRDKKASVRACVKCVQVVKSLIYKAWAASYVRKIKGSLLLILSMCQERRSMPSHLSSILRRQCAFSSPNLHLTCDFIGLIET